MKGINFLFLLTLVACASDPRDKELVLNESLRQCYVESDSYTGRKGTVQGEMTVRLEVNPEGKAVSCKITQNDFKDPNLNACVCGMYKMALMENISNGHIITIHTVKFSPVQQ